MMSLFLFKIICTKIFLKVGESVGDEDFSLPKLVSVRADWV